MTIRVVFVLHQVSAHAGVLIRETFRWGGATDSRSDLYSLGVTLYEMLTGSLPFTASDAMKWVHCHIAKQPVPPGERLTGIPAPVSAIILKLLASALGSGSSHNNMTPFMLGSFYWKL